MASRPACSRASSLGTRRARRPRLMQVSWGCALQISASTASRSGPVAAATAVVQARLGHHLGPGAEQKVRYFGGTISISGRSRISRDILAASRVALLGMAQGLDGLQALFFFAFSRVWPRCSATGPGPVQRAPGLRWANGSMGPPPRSAAAWLETVGFEAFKGQTAVRHFLQQAACRVILAAEEPRVFQCQFQQAGSSFDELLDRPGADGGRVRCCPA